MHYDNLLIVSDDAAVAGPGVPAVAVDDIAVAVAVAGVVYAAGMN